MRILYEIGNGWYHYEDDNGDIHFVVSLEAFEKLKKKGEK